MAIDNCEYSFKTLAEQVLPNHMARMRKAMGTPFDMIQFGTKGIGPKSILECLGRSEDFPGCYVLMDGTNPVYVGISRSVIQRLLQHLKGTSHFDASLAYRIASEHYPHHMDREKAMTHPGFKEAFGKAKNYLKSLRVAFIEIENDLEVYLFEVYCAMKLDTSKWNSFRTH